MAKRDQPTPRFLDGDGRDEPGGPDLPLTSIPSVPENDADDGGDRRGAASHIVVGAALFVLIVAISVLGARFLKLPKSPLAIAPAEETRLGDPPAPAGTAAPSEPSLAAAAPVAPPVLSQAPPQEPERSPAEVELGAVRRELEQSSRALFAARRDLQEERELRRAAEKRAEDAARGTRAQKAAQDDGKLDRKSRARLQSLEKEAAALRKEAADARRALAAAETRAQGQEASGAEAQARIDAAEKRARAAETQLKEIRTGHEQALQGESQAVRKLVADLNAARDAGAAEKAARAEAERRSRSLESEVARLRAAGGAPVSHSATAPASAPPSRAPVRESVAAAGAASVKEPERVQTQPPYYPEELRRARVGGRVLLRLLVGESGRVEDVQVTRAPDPRLGELAAAAAKRWTYTPGRRDGIRAKVWITEAVDFKL